MDNKIYSQAVEAIEVVDGIAVISDLEIQCGGTQIDVIDHVEAYEGAGKKFRFYAGNPYLDGTDDEEDWEELKPTEEEEEQILKEFVANF